MTTAAISETRVTHAKTERWRHLILCVICMIFIANFQYGWSVFVLPLHKAHAWSISNIQFAFTVFVALETWGTPLNGWLADRLGPHLGPRVVMGVGGVFVALGWIINSYANSLPLLYLGGALAGLGAGAVYCTAVGTAVKWFTDNRGLAVGLVAGGFGAGAALTIIPIQMTIKASGYASAFFWAGLLQGGLVLIVSQFIRNPNPGEAPVKAKTPGKIQQSTYSYSPHEVLTSRVFWVLYILDLLMCAGGLIVTAYLAPIADSYHVSEVVVFMGATTLSIALIFANIMNGIARPFFGWVSDRIGLPETMGIAFALGAISYFMLSVTGKYPWGLIFFVGMVFFCWGEIFSLFPAMCTDLFGQKYATTNSALLYTAKGAAAFLVPLGGWAAATSGNWTDVLYLTTGINIVAIILVFAVLRPAAASHHATTNSEKVSAKAS
jgi:MFS transporter, OFA family, oxalate/formate antiporter